MLCVHDDLNWYMPLTTTKSGHWDWPCSTAVKFSIWHRWPLHIVNGSSMVLWCPRVCHGLVLILFDWQDHSISYHWSAVFRVAPSSTQFIHGRCHVNSKHQVSYHLLMTSKLMLVYLSVIIHWRIIYFRTVLATLAHGVHHVHFSWMRPKQNLFGLAHAKCSVNWVTVILILRRQSFI